VNKFLRDKKVNSFKIEDGRWKFYYKNAKGEELPVTDQYKLDSVGTDELEANLSKGVKEKHEAEIAQAKANKEADKKRLEDVSNINSEPQAVARLTEAGYFEKMVDDAGFKGKELAGELKQKFLAQFDAAVAGGKIPPDLMRNGQGLPVYSAEMNEADKLKGASELLAKMGINEMLLKEGQLIYRKAGTEVKELFAGAEGIFVSEKARQSGVEKKAKEEKEVQKGDEIKKGLGVEKPGTEPALEKAILEKIKEPLNYRYVEGIKALYEYKGGEIRFKLPATDDKALNCTFKENPNKKGDYILVYAKAGRFDLQSRGASREATILWMIKYINNGGFARELQGNNLRTKPKFERNGFDNIDSGPEMVDPDDIEDLKEDGYGISPETQKMELDWESRGTDPMVYMTPGLHGKIDVIVKKSDIGGEGKDYYRFTADGFQDMTRRLGALRQWREPTENDKQRADLNALEKTNRHLESAEFNKMLAGVGEVEGVKFPAQSTLEVRYSWLTKQKPGEAFVIVARPLGQGFQYAVKMKSGTNYIFQAATETELQAKLKDEKLYLSTVGGEQKRNQEVETVLKDTPGGPYHLTEGVKVYGLRGNKLELAWGDGKVPTQFEMPGEMAKAKEMGMVYVEGEKEVKPYQGAKLEEQTFSSGLKVEGKIGPDLPEYAKKEIDVTAKKIVDPNKRQQFVDLMNNALNKTVPETSVKRKIMINLTVMAGELLKKSEIPLPTDTKQMDEAITKYVRIINSNKEKRETQVSLIGKLDKSVQDSLEKLPRSKKLVENLLMFVERIDFSSSQNAELLEGKIAADYQKFLNAELLEIFKNPQKEVKSEDLRVITEISKLKDAYAYTMEWIAARDAFDAKEAQAKKTYETQDRIDVSKAHRGKLKDLIAKEDVGSADDLRYKAMQLLTGLTAPEKTSALKYDPELSNLVENNLNNYNSVYLNIEVEGRDYTLGLIRTNDGKITYTMAEGKNHPAKFGAGGMKAVELGPNSQPKKAELDLAKGDSIKVMVNRLRSIK
jgi:hypothetical protein